ncbi:MAG: transketolase [Clostridia bacterium]|nr:transketolase [Clostridia bacterium]
MNNMDNKAVNAVRCLAIDAIQAANSGHPGLPLGAAPFAYKLYADHMKFSPSNPKFIDRDRFVLSAGHGSALMYSLLYHFGFGLTMDDIKNFRQLGYKTSGHPEYGTPGVETSTGPLGQGIANAVGMALAESVLAAKFNKPGLNLVDHYTYALLGEGCLMEGIEYEAASLAGTLKLNKLIVLYDCNKITIEGNSDIAFDEDIFKRHEAQGWNVIVVECGEDLDAVDAAIQKAKHSDKPTLIAFKTVIGYGSPKAGSASCHGAPLGLDGVVATKKALGYEYAPFEVPQDVTEHFAKKIEQHEKECAEWEKIRDEYKKKYPDEYAEFEKWHEKPVIEDTDDLWQFDSAMSTRKAGGVMLNRLAARLDNFIGGSADLAPSNLTGLKDVGDYGKDNRLGRNIHFGIREHAMAAICNGIYLHGGLLPFCSTFFAFSDYLKNAIRMSAIMNIPVLYVFSHDSIGVGEDGPTHQPIEQLAGLRAMPNLKVFRPCDARETAAAFVSAYDGGPTVVVESRQDLPLIEGSGRKALKGGYVIKGDGECDLCIIAAGSEVDLAVRSADELEKTGIKVRVVSMPCMEIFDEQTEEYKNSVIPRNVKKIAIEAGSAMCWYKYVGDGALVCIDHFGESGKANKLFERYGFTVENVVDTAKKLLQK